MKKTAIVTGSSRGIGFAIAKQLGLDGYNIVMVATGPQEKNQHALDELKAMGIDCAYVQANIGCTDDRKKILDAALAAFGRVDVLVNNAGVAPKVRADLLDMTSKVQGKYDALIEKGTFPIARWGTPEDVAGAVSLLCSDRLRYTTGNYIDVDGGFHIQRL